METEKQIIKEFRDRSEEGSRNLQLDGDRERKKDDGFKEEQKMAGEIYFPNDGDREKNI